MKPMRARLIAIALGSGLIFAISLRARALAQANDELVAERSLLATTQLDLRELENLRERREVVAAAKRPTQDVLAQVNAALRDAGISGDRFKGLDPEGDVSAGGRYRVQTLRLSLDRLTIPEVGAFLAAWRERQSVWTPASLELAHDGSDPNRSDFYHLRIVLSATYLSDAPVETTR